MATIITGKQAWTIEHLEGTTYVSTTARGVVYTICQTRWSWTVGTCRLSLRGSMGGCSHHSSAADVAQSRKALRDFPLVLDAIADGIQSQLDALTARAA